MSHYILAYKNVNKGCLCTHVTLYHAQSLNAAIYAKDREAINTNSLAYSIL
jgi:hypothetical protein